MNKTILFYPDPMMKGMLWWYVCNELGLNMINTQNINQSFDLAVYWKIARGRLTIPDEKILSLSKEMRVINIDCTSVLKGLVDKTWGDVSGNSITINPQEYNGEYVRKSQLNWKSHTGEVHDGKVFNTPMKVDPNYVYQKFIQNHTDHGYLIYRMTMVNKKPAVLLVKHCKLMFKGGFVKTELFHDEKMRAFFTEDELKHINLFNIKMGIDFASVDFLRDKNTGILYAIDVNEKAAMDAALVLPDKGKGFLRILAQHFKNEFYADRY